MGWVGRVLKNHRTIEHIGLGWVGLGWKDWVGRVLKNLKTTECVGLSWVERFGLEGFLNIIGA